MEELYDVDSTGDGNVIITGYSNSLNGDVTTNKGGYDAYVLKIDPSGNKLWWKSFGGTGNETFSGTMILQNEIVVVGNSSSVNGDISSNKGGVDGILVSYDQNGNLLWNKNYGGTLTDAFSSIIPLQDEFVVFGYSASNGGDIPLNKGGTDITIFTFDLRILYETIASTSIQSGEFSLSNMTPSVFFGSVVVDNTIQTIHVNLPDLQVKDHRGTGAGWNLSVEGTPLTSTANPSSALEPNSFIFNGIQSISTISGNSFTSSTIVSTPVSIDNGSVKIVGVSAGGSTGTYDIVFPTDVLSLFVDTSEPLNINGPTSFESTITWTLSTGP